MTLEGLSEQMVETYYSGGDWLGENFGLRPASEIFDSDGRKFIDRQFDPARRSYYKYFLHGDEKEVAVPPPWRKLALRYRPEADTPAARLAMEWTDAAPDDGGGEWLPLPGAAVWVDEGGATGLLHFAVEPTTSPHADPVRGAPTVKLAPGTAWRWRVAFYASPVDGE